MGSEERESWRVERSCRILGRKKKARRGQDGQARLKLSRRKRETTRLTRTLERVDRLIRIPDGSETLSVLNELSEKKERVKVEGHQ